jgi:mannosidase alpha-like ER degradation enhancer 3
VTVNLFFAVPAFFKLVLLHLQVEGIAIHADPLRACQTLAHPEQLVGKLVVVERGDCMFVDKARHLLAAGAIGGIVIGKSA